MSATMPSSTCARPNVEWRWPCGANLRLRWPVHWIVLATSSADPGQQDALRQVVHDVPEVVSARVARRVVEAELTIQLRYREPNVHRELVGPAGYRLQASRLDAFTAADIRA